ncbi:MAG: Rpn family recombination-promoting nuclease/putative transposase [Peptococcaceae bacterium]|nr:Rpn family recombination-promoting nuclease/putative transposase [Peptococcaceae bacterium]
MSFDNTVIPELLPPYEDGVFKTLLTHPDAKPVLRDIVESYLRFPVVKVEVRNVELPISDINEKRERFDVNCTINDGSQLDVEMQSEAMTGDSLRKNHKIVKSRAIYHLCDLHSGQDGRSIRYDKLLRSFQMTFCGYTVFPKSEHFVSRYNFRDEYGMELSDAVGIVFIELTKLDDVVKRSAETMTGEEAWSVFFAFGSDPKYRELLNKLMAVRREIKMANELLQSISKDEIERARFRSRRMFRMDMEHSLIAARDEGETSKAKNIARNLLKRNRPIEEIMEDTGLTQDEVKKLTIDQAGDLGV